jgi:ligand-binding SRPBCC domain-containing protein
MEGGSMASIKKNIEINSSLEHVFDFVSNPDNWTRYVTSLMAVENTSEVPIKIGTTFQWTYRMLGMDFQGTGKVLEYEKDNKFSIRMEGHFPITETYTFAGDSEKTTLGFQIDYELPGKVLGVLADRAVIEKLNVKEADTVLDKVKIMCEEGA